MGFRIKIKRFKLGKVLKTVAPAIGALTGLGGLAAPVLSVASKIKSLGRMAKQATQRPTMPPPIPFLEERTFREQAPERPEADYQEVEENTDTGEIQEEHKCPYR